MCNLLMLTIFSIFSFQDTAHKKTLQHAGSADDLYDSIRMTSQGPFIGRTNKFDIKGYLHIRKGLYFILITSQGSFIGWGRLGHDHKVDGFTTSCASSAYRH